jgi:hypothetical protein
LDFVRNFGHVVKRKDTSNLEIVSFGSLTEKKHEKNVDMICRGQGRRGLAIQTPIAVVKTVCS